jgi:hypothetical protein
MSCPEFEGGLLSDFLSNHFYSLNKSFVHLLCAGPGLTAANGEAGILLLVESHPAGLEIPKINKTTPWVTIGGIGAGDAVKTLQNTG